MSGLLDAGTCPCQGETSDFKSPLGAQRREPLTEARFQQLWGGAEPEPQRCGAWRRRARGCSRAGVWRLLLARLPPLCWLRVYRWRAWLVGDAVAGVTVGIVHVPQGERPTIPTQPDWWCPGLGGVLEAVRQRGPDLGSRG